MKTKKRVLVSSMALLAAQGVAVTALADVTLSVQSPSGPSARAGTSLPVSVVVTSTYAVTGVVASVGALSTKLTAPASQGLPWTGSVTTGSLPYAAETLTIVATDTFGNTGTATVPFFHDNPPSISITSPLQWTVVGSSLSVAATCTDDDACASLTSVVVTPLTGTTSVSTTVDVTRFTGQVADAYFTATDSHGSTTTATRRFYVDPSPRLVASATVPNGYILDFDAARLLYLRASDSAIVLRDRATNADTTLGLAPYATTRGPNGDAGNTSGTLTSTGAVWFTKDQPGVYCDDGAMSANYWVGGKATRFGLIPDCSKFPNNRYPLAGDWALIPPPANDGTGTFSISAINLSSGTVVAHAFPFAVGDSNVFSSSVSANGDVQAVSFSTDPPSVFVSHAGVATSLGSAGGSLVQSGQAPFLGDGTNFAFFTQGDGTSDNLDVFSLGAHTNDLVPVGYLSTNLYVPNPLQVSNGWTAFTQVVSGVQQISSRSPTGVTTQLSVFNTDSTLDAIGANGDVTWLNADGGTGPTMPATRYLRNGSALPEVFNTALGNAKLGCDGWYVELGDTLFKISGTDDAGTGPCASPVGVDGGGDGGPGAGSDGGIGPGSSPPVDDGGGDGSTGSASGPPADDGGCSTVGTSNIDVIGSWAFGVLAAAALLRKRRKTG